MDLPQACKRKLKGKEVTIHHRAGVEGCGLLDEHVDRLVKLLLVVVVVVLVNDRGLDLIQLHLQGNVLEICGIT